MTRGKKQMRTRGRRGSSSRVEKLSYRELLDLQSRVSAAIEKRRLAERQELASKLEALAASSGFSLPEVLGMRRRAGKSANGTVVRYRHPKDPNLTWTGRGRRPKWLVSAGRNIERYRVA